MLLSLTEVRNRFGSAAYTRGRKYYENGRVTQLSYDERGFRYTAKVKGTKTYSVQIDVGEEAGGFFDVYCTCPAFDSFAECKHAAAVAIAICKLTEGQRNVPQARYSAPDKIIIPTTTSPRKPVKPSYSIAEQMISYFANTNNGRDEDGLRPNRDVLQFEYILKVPSSYRGNQLSLEIKTGIQRLYVVPKIHSFLDCLEQGDSLYFTKRFTFDPSRQFIPDADAAFLKMLILIKNTERVYNASTSYSGYWGAVEKKSRELIVAPFAWDRLITLIPQVKIMLEGGGYSGIPLKVTDEPLPLTFTLGQHANQDYRLRAEGVDKLLLFPEHSAVFADGRMHRLERDVLDILMQIKQGYASSRAFDIPSASIASLVQEVLPALRRVGKVAMDRTVRGKIAEPELRGGLYLDYQEGILSIRLAFQYDTVTIDPLSPEPNDGMTGEVILVRQREKEEAILRVLDAPFLTRNGSRWTAEKEADVFGVLYETVPSLEDKVDIYISQSARGLTAERKPQPSISADLSRDLDWLEISFELDGATEREVLQVMKGIVEKKKYIRLQNGAFMSLLGDEFADFREVSERLGIGKKDLNSSFFRLPSVQALRLPERQTSSSGRLKWGRSLRTFLDQLKEPDSLDFKVPASLAPVVRDYQVQGFQWMKTLSRFRFGGILADEMGLGKTLQSIAYILSELEEATEPRRMLIVCPASLTYNWADEFAKFAPGVKVLLLTGQKEERNELAGVMEEFDVVVTSYPLLRRDAELYADRTFHTLFLDEAQAIKNAGSQTAQAVKNLASGRAFALTGTPMENSMEELWSIFHAVFPSLFPSQVGFRDLSAEQIARFVSPFIMRRLKKDVLEELPDRIETVRHSELLEEQKLLYAGYLSKVREETESDIRGEGFNRNRMKILAGITRLRQLCCHPALFVENYSGSSGKLNQLLETVEESRADGRRLLIFSQFSGMLKLIRDTLEKQKLNILYLDGSTPSADRVDLCRSFNEGEGDAFLISLKAGGTGLNLTGADTVVLYDLWWNPAVEEQAIGRAHRMGQRNVVQVIRLITKGTIEEKILELQRRKKDLIRDVIDSGESVDAKWSEEDIMELLRM